jgi:hypothetical protein
MAKDIVHETMHEMLAFDLLMDAGGDIDKAMARFKAELLTPPTADELNSAREYMERTRVNARPARYGAAAELIRGDRALDRGARQAGEAGMTGGEALMREELTRTLALALKQLIESGFELPIKVAVLPRNDDAGMLATYSADSAAQDGLHAEFHHMHGGNFALPVNMFFVDSRGEAARFMITNDGPGQLSTLH